MPEPEGQDLWTERSGPLQSLLSGLRFRPWAEISLLESPCGLRTFHGTLAPLRGFRGHFRMFMNRQLEGLGNYCRVSGFLMRTLR